MSLHKWYVAFDNLLELNTSRTNWFVGFMMNTSLVLPLAVFTRGFFRRSLSQLRWPVALVKLEVLPAQVRCTYTTENTSALTHHMEQQRETSGCPTYIYRLESVDLQHEVAHATTPSAADLLLHDIDFENHAEAFRGKTTWELVRALGVLRMCGLDVLVNNSLQLMTWTRRMCGRHVLRALFKPMFYRQFVGGETPQEIGACVRRLAEGGIRAMLATTMEEDIGEGGKEDVYEANCCRIMECLGLATADDTQSPMIQLKLSGLLSADLLVELGNIYHNSQDKLTLVDAVAQGIMRDSTKVEPFCSFLNDQQTDSIEKAIARLRKIGKEAKAKGVKVLVDAEYTHLNPGLSLLTMAMAAAFNQHSPIIWNTYQCYLKDAYSKVLDELSLTSKLGVAFGAKVVRGAYLSQERIKAQRLALPDPICDDYQATSTNYNKVVTFLLEHTENVGSKCNIIVASHNEGSVKLAVEKMKELNLDRQHGGVCFGQLYGMCDQVTSPLAQSGYSVYKSIPYGSVEEVLPYLARRAMENRTVLQGARKEQELLWKELKARMARRMRCQSALPPPDSSSSTS